MYLHIHQGLRSQIFPAQDQTAPGTKAVPRPFLPVTPGIPAMLTPIVQAQGSITLDHVKARTIQHLSNGSPSSHPCQGHHVPMS